MSDNLQKKDSVCRCIPNIGAAMRDGIDHDPNVTHPLGDCKCQRCDNVG